MREVGGLGQRIVGSHFYRLSIHRLSFGNSAIFKCFGLKDTRGRKGDRALTRRAEGESCMQRDDDPIFASE